MKVSLGTVYLEEITRNRYYTERINLVILYRTGPYPVSLSCLQAFYFPHWMSEAISALLLKKKVFKKSNNFSGIERSRSKAVIHVPVIHTQVLSSEP